MIQVTEVWNNVTDDIIYQIKDYINIDSSLKTTGIPNDNEIISSILEVPEVEEEINDIILSILHKTVLESIENIYNYLQQ
ncbi:6582_t:CDS:2 [Diversispora eburnea]|uniref:6582_t:CDS:1 n=1 Tax=Diversispora eburnea TaxID=1213867 RepID=A0A9N9G6K6_9GLOM|nr:6582_t:CDS:2 [Diversispora eburnea]